MVWEHLQSKVVSQFAVNIQEPCWGFPIHSPVLITLNMSVRAILKPVSNLLFALARKRIWSQ